MLSEIRNEELPCGLLCSRAVVTLRTSKMLDSIEKLLILQDRDRKLRRVEGELAHIGPDRQELLRRAASAEAGVEHAKHQIKEIETRRKSFELEVDGKKQSIVKYANQQLQTRKNEEYQALSREIDGCRSAIVQLEDSQLELMEQAEVAQSQLAEANKVMIAARKAAEEQVAKLNAREENLKKELEQLRSNRDQLASAVDESARGRYERLLRNKGENVVVGVNHGVCGGCHMRVPPQLLVSCQADKELVTCSNCGRILYWTADMDLAMAD